MSRGRNKYQSRDDRRRINTILMQEWDPIGLGTICPADEYQAYADKAYVMLMDEEASAEELAKYLVNIATAHMGLSLCEDLVQRSKQTASMLVTIRPELHTH